jgi:hypothetical protein
MKMKRAVHKNPYEFIISAIKVGYMVGIAQPV